MNLPSPLILAATLMVAAGAAVFTDAQASQSDAARVAQLRAGAAKVSTVETATLAIDPAADMAMMAQLRAGAARASSVGPGVIVLAAR